MPIDYVAYNDAGSRVTGVVDVETEEEAERRLWGSGLLVVRLRAQRTVQVGLPTRLALRVFGAGIQDVITFTRQLETLLRAGISLHPALRQLRMEARGIALREAIRQMAIDIEAGDRFSRAVGRHPKIFPAYFLRMVPLAEATGELPRLLKDLVRTMERQAVVAARARQAILTPALSLLVGFGALFVLFTLVLPRLVELLSEFDAELPATTRALVAIANFSQTNGMRTAIGLVVAGVGLFAFLRLTRAGQRFWHRTMLRLPVVGGVVMSSTLFDVSAMYALLLETGVAPVVALRTVTVSIGNSVLRDAFQRVEAEVTAGGRLGAALRKQAAIPSLFTETVSNGEQAGALTQNLSAMADYYQEETNRRVQAGTTLIEPVAFLIVGGVIGFVAVAIMSGIYSIIPQISGGFGG